MSNFLNIVVGLINLKMKLEYVYVWIYFLFNIYNQESEIFISVIKLFRYFKNLI